MIKLSRDKGQDLKFNPVTEKNSNQKNRKQKDRLTFDYELL